ncbi:Disease resistance protein [Macleaya cordata]|uniref:Disease resistance protein n=1 Tax=Macleaya cordata TaxID=56857 RepID=A0A200R7Y8_MACCD|nr:Disease resistance protein [Macleaya cordata]
MAEAVVTFFLEKLSGLLTQEANLLGGVDEQVTSLQNMLQWLLHDIKRLDLIRRQDDRVKLWVNQIQDVAYDAEDVIDEFMVKISQPRHGIGHGFAARTLMRCITCTHKFPVLHELANQIKVINARVEEISANKSRCGIQSIEAAGESSMTMMNSNSTNEVLLLMRKEKRPPIADEWNVVGNEDSIRELKSLLIGGELRLTVVSIVGMGGLGKTTLANKVYQNQDVRGSFDRFSWVTVSQQYRTTKELFQGMFKSFELSYSNHDDEETNDGLRKKLREFLQGRKYLIVLDDIWNVEAWDELNTVFPDEENGSRVLITTRNKDVALYADPSGGQLHELHFLNEVESWELFLRKIFGFRGKTSPDEVIFSCPPELVDLGKQMVVKCGGLPLAIVVLGGLLSIKDKTQIAWSKVNDSVSWHLSTHGAGLGSCSRILALSYYNLPFYLKPCFLYMGLFPQDYEIRSSKLVQYWIAEGFIQRRGEETMEDVAEDYLEELIQRNMIQVVRRKRDGRIKRCRIHDLLLDLSVTKAKEDQFCEVYGRVSEFSKTNKIRRLSIHSVGLKEKEQCFSEFPNYTPHIRSLICSFIRIDGKQFLSLCRASFNLLRVLELNLEWESVVPEEIGDLVHLKYLALLATGGLKRIPKSIGRLVNLQFLDLGYTDLKIFPSVICNLTQLRYLCVCGLSIKDKQHLDRNPLRVDKLTNLQTLKSTSGSWIEDGGLSKLRELKKLVIRGSLVPYKNEILPNSIAKLDGLRSLKLSISEEIPNLLPFSNHKFLYKLRLEGTLVKSLCTTDFFPPNLIKLTLFQSQLEVDPMKTLEKLSNLRFFQLWVDSYVGKELVCSEGGFVKLQDLEIWGLKGLEEWVVKEGALISLRRLEIKNCKRLKMLPDGLQNLSTIQELKLVRMSDELMDRVKDHNVGSDWEKIKHIPSVDTKYGKESDFATEFLRFVLCLCAC